MIEYGLVSFSEEQLRDAGRRLLGAAWDRLHAEHVVPTPRFHPYLRVGRDYIGDWVRSLAEYEVLETLIKEAHPRFADDLPLHEREFPDGYAFSLIEAFVAQQARLAEPTALDGPETDKLLDDLVRVVQADTFEVACCRAVSYLTTAGGQPIDFGDVRVEPVAQDSGRRRRDMYGIIQSVIADAGSAYGRDLPGAFGSPTSVLVVRGTGPKPFEQREPLSSKIERLLLLIRLLKPCTSVSMFEVQGETHRVRQFDPILVLFRGEGPSFDSPTQLAARTAVLSPEDIRPVDGLGALLDQVQQPQPGMVFTSFGMAISKFLMSYHAHAWHEQIVDLATAFEATLSGKETSDVTLRLRNRAATLLATDHDPAEAIFQDVNVIYGLRSTLVHGGPLKNDALIKYARKISTVHTGLRDGEAVAHLVERLRDLVRRSLLARICLASGDTPLWPLASDDGVDVAMADDLRRSQWRQSWRDTVESFEALAAAELPPRRSAQPAF